ncbi:MAG: hypothetical protein HY080_16930 [Gammaproteobacteria bacterium]|nr:hypothetical protein [Gammaproteobacteria bacterium]
MRDYLAKHKARALSTLGFFMWLVHGCAAADNPGLNLDQQLEEWYLTRLAAVQADPQNHLAEFSSDGCSGGLSDGWTSLSKLLPAFKKKFADHPPYEPCCVTHDRAYWRGDVEQGYIKRKQADTALRACVVNYGENHRAEFAEEFKLSEDNIVRNFRVIADMMYYAVRLGGKPCSYLPWRWGYGWPDCSLGEAGVTEPAK